MGARKAKGRENENRLFRLSRGAEELVRALKGAIPNNVVNRDVLSKSASRGKQLQD